MGPKKLEETRLDVKPDDTARSSVWYHLVFTDQGTSERFCLFQTQRAAENRSCYDASKVCTKVRPFIHMYCVL